MGRQRPHLRTRNRKDFFAGRKGIDEVFQENLDEVADAGKKLRKRLLKSLE